MKAKAAVLFSGGKDSCLALHKAIEKGYEINVLVAMIPESKDSMMFHTPDEKLLRKQAEMLNIPLFIGKTMAKNEKQEIEDLSNTIKAAKEKYKFDNLVIGGIASSYQGNRINDIGKKNSLTIIAPVWTLEGERVWKNLLDLGFKVIIIKIACEGIPKRFLGKIITREEFEELNILAKKHKFRLDFEGGEAETAVLWMPEFSKEIKIEFEVYSEDKYRHFIKIIRII